MFALVGSFLLFFLFPLLNISHARPDCTVCHTSIMSKLNHHQGAEMGCTNCHGEHGTSTGNAFRLLDKVNNLCAQCHDVNSGVLQGHPVTGHKVESAADPINSRKPFTCTSCHNPHSSDVPYLFQYNFTIPPYSNGGS